MIWQILAVYAAYKIMKWLIGKVRTKITQKQYETAFLRELRKEVQADPVYFEQHFGVKIPPD